MTRLTRTQKYADLRNQIDNNPEPQLNTKELASYEDRLERSGGDILPGSETRSDYNRDYYVNQQVEAPMRAAGSRTTERTYDQYQDFEPRPAGGQYDVVDDISVSDLLGRDGFGRAAAPTQSSYVEDTLNEVRAYNKSIGSMTVEDVPETILNEIRGVNEGKDELSNTATLEIKKFLTEMDEPAVQTQPEVARPVAPAAQPEPINEAPLVAEEATGNAASGDSDLEAMRRFADKLPKDVSDLLKQYLESTQEDVYGKPEVTPQAPQPQPQPQAQAVTEPLEAEAETLSKTFDTSLEATSDTMSNSTTSLMNDTMPLQVERTTSMSPIEDDEEYYEFSDSSRILNIILVVLIVILVLVLIVVAYLILVAQGIIPNLV